LFGAAARFRCCKSCFHFNSSVDRTMIVH
jgi:hypothetical protein